MVYNGGVSYRYTHALQNQPLQNTFVNGRWPNKTNSSVLTESLRESSSSIDRIIASASVSPISSRIYKHNHIPALNTYRTIQDPLQDTHTPHS